MTSPLAALAALGSSPAAAAGRALAAAGVHVERLDSLERVRDAEALFGTVWRSPQSPPMTADVMRAVEHAGGYVMGAYDGARLLAASSGFVAIGPDGRCRLHSHISGVLPAAQGRRVGWALKLHQRAWALDRGIETVTWTFDPLVRRNAWFNLGKLGARGVEYLVDFYGPMDDGLNAGEPSDRLFTRWDLRSPAAVAAVAGAPAVAAACADGLVLDERDGWPLALQPTGSCAPVLRLPVDVEQLRSDRPEAAHAWRLAVREALAPLLRDGTRSTGVSADGRLVVSA